jgi:hypothetical protein
VSTKSVSGDGLNCKARRESVPRRRLKPLAKVKLAEHSPGQVLIEYGQTDGLCPRSTLESKHWMMSHRPLNRHDLSLVVSVLRPNPQCGQQRKCENAPDNRQSEHNYGRLTDPLA